MESLIKAGLYSLDNDLQALVTDRKAVFTDCVQLQLLRILRGKPFNVDLNGPKTTLEGWSADGIKWIPNQPGNGTGVAE